MCFQPPLCKIILHWCISCKTLVCTWKSLGQHIQTGHPQCMRFLKNVFCCIIVWNTFNQSNMSNNKLVFVTRIYSRSQHAILFLTLSTLFPPLHFSRTAKLCIPPFSICIAFNQPGLLYPSEGYRRSGYCTSNATPFVGDLHVLAALRGLTLRWPSDNTLERYFNPECVEVCFCSQQ